jgi:hypothetical protein
LAEYNISEDGKQTIKFKNIGEAIEELGNDTMKWVAKCIRGEDHFAVNTESNNINDILGNTPKEINKKISEYLKLKYESNDDVDENVTSDYEDMTTGGFIDEHEEELKDLLEQADYRAQERGTESEMYGALWTELENSGLVFTDYDSPCEYIISENIIDVLYNPTEPNDNEKSLLNLEEPHYGWSGYSKEAFTEDYKLNHFLDTQIEELKGKSAT